MWSKLKDSSKVFHSAHSLIPPLLSVLSYFYLISHEFNFKFRVYVSSLSRRHVSCAIERNQLWLPWQLPDASLNYTMRKKWENSARFHIPFSLSYHRHSHTKHRSLRVRKSRKKREWWEENFFIMLFHSFLIHSTGGRLSCSLALFTSHIIFIEFKGDYIFIRLRCCSLHTFAIEASIHCQLFWLLNPDY